MFEFLFAKKYLIPKRRQLSVSLIAIMSVVVISLVVWLVLVFLSVTEGIEKGWLKRLTALNAPLRITPTKEYFHSYYHLVDSIAYRSGYTLKTLGEKARSDETDPFDPEIDSSIPSHWPKPLVNDRGTMRDLVKELLSTINGVQTPPLIAQDYQISGALLRLRMIRPEIGSPLEERQNFLTQVSYIASFSDKNPSLKELIQPPAPAEIDHLFHMAELSTRNIVNDQAQASERASVSEFQSQLKALLAHVKIKAVETAYDFWRLPLSLISDRFEMEAFAKKEGPLFSHIVLSTKKPDSSYVAGKVIFHQGSLFFEGEKLYPLPLQTPLLIDKRLTFTAELDSQTLSDARSLRDLTFSVEGQLSGQPLAGHLPWRDLEIAEIEFLTPSQSTLPPPWVYFDQTLGHYRLPQPDSILLPKSYQESGVQIGDCGYLSFGAMTVNSMQEQRLPIRVAGFYDPGVMSLGAKYLLCHPELVRDIASANQSFSFDREMASGIQVWFDDLDQTAAIEAELQKALDAEGLSPFWRITPFYRYDFAKDLLQQFQSDRYLFTLIGLIILVVACTNIISLLVLLVNDKKEEIGILQAMGASTRSIGAIFALSGVFMGVIGSAIGALLALITLRHIDTVVQILSFLQGHQAFNSAFYGKSLPNELSSSALLFILITTPVISLLAGIIPAVKACRLRPSEILRS